MSTPSSPGSFASPAAGWYPNLNGVAPQTASAITQAYTLLYSLRDTVNQLQASGRMTAQYGTHLERTQTNPQAVPDGALFFELDNQSVFYQSRLAPRQTTRSWFYAGGVATNTLANRPDYLGANDAGFLFIATDNSQLYIWSGAAWSVVA